MFFQARAPVAYLDEVPQALQFSHQAAHLGSASQS